MTTPGGWPPPEARPPFAPGPPGPHLGNAPAAAYPPRPAPSARDQTARTIGIVALVVGVLALLAQLAMVVLPGLLFLPLVFGAAGGWGDEGWSEGPMPSATSTFSGGVTLDAGRSVAGETMAAAVRRHGEETGAIGGIPSSLRCDDVARATPRTSVLCRAADGDEWYAVVRFTDDQGAFVVTVLSDVDDPW